MNEELRYFADRGFLISPELLDKIKSVDKEKILENLSKNVVVVNEDLARRAEEERCGELNWIGFDEARVLFEKRGYDEEYNTFLDVILERKVDANSNGVGDFLEQEDMEGGVVVLRSYNEKSKKMAVEDFVALFNSRYKLLKEILCNRLELRDTVSISRIVNKENERVALIGIVSNKRTTKNGNLLLEIEDLSGKINVLINKNRNELREAEKEIVLDEVIGVTGNTNNGFVFAERIFFPDVPVIKELKKSPVEESAVFISDLHVGNKTFLERDFNKFLEWLNSEDDEVKKIKYLFILGDLIEGIGIYPGQEGDLEIKDYYKQYEKFVELIKKVPTRVNIILCPGNHDALRLDEPQPALGENFLGELIERGNVFSVSNPAFVNIGASKDFSGFDVLIYHGGSFAHYADSVDSIRLAGGLKRADLILKFLLKKRHLAPTHTSTSYLAGKRDNLVIDLVPDFFVGGHIHRCTVENYNNITMINASCWVPQSDYMEKRGMEPEPCRAIIVNLDTRGCKIKIFGDGSK